MPNSQDSINCIKNLIQLMCCDGNIDAREKNFLTSAVQKMRFDITPFGSWSDLTKQVHKDGIDLYPVKDKKKAQSTLKGLIVMAQADGKVDSREKALILNFAKAINVGNAEFRDILKDIDPNDIFEVFEKTPKDIGNLVALEEEFEKLSEMVDVAEENGVSVKISSTKAFLANELTAGTIVCFHGSPEKEESLKRCKILLKKAGSSLICILSRFQGLQVKYLHELGLRKCIIEPVYSKDVLDMFKSNPPKDLKNAAK